MSTTKFINMMKKALTTASAIALCGTFFAKANSTNYGIGIDGGASFGGVKHKENQYAKEIGGDMTYNLNLSPYFGIDFGDKGNEVVGFEIAAGFGGRKLAIKSAGLTNAEKAAKQEAKSPFELWLMGATFSVLGKGMFARFDGVCMFVKAGLDGYYAFIKFVKSFGESPKDKKNRKAIEQRVKELNLAGKFVLGVELLDGGMSIGLAGRYFFLEQYNPSAEEKAIMKAKGTSMSLGANQIDVNFFVQFNIAKLLMT